MKYWRATAVAAAAFLVAISSGTVAAAGNGPPGKSDSERRFTFAVIGDIPYGDPQIKVFHPRIDEINADPDVRLVDHLGDIKSGSSPCTDEYFADRKKDFDHFADPLVYTPGDNEWTDCHRANNGSYNPLERLAAVRQVFFPEPGRTLGQHAIRVSAQTDQGYPENVTYQRNDVAFAAVHIVGSNNSLLPWTDKPAPTPEQTAEVLGRTAADIQWIRDTFRRAKAERNRAVVLLTQADMFDPTVPSPAFAEWYAFQPIVRAIAQEAAKFPGPVYLFDGDSHVYTEDHPLAAGSSWLSFYGVEAPVSNLTRITVEGSTGVDEWLKVTVDRSSQAVLKLERVPFRN